MKKNSIILIIIFCVFIFCKQKPEQSTDNNIENMVYRGQVIWLYVEINNPELEVDLKKFREEYPFAESYSDIIVAINKIEYHFTLTDTDK